MAIGRKSFPWLDWLVYKLGLLYSLLDLNLSYARLKSTSSDWKTFLNSSRVLKNSTPRTGDTSWTSLWLTFISILSVEILFPHYLLVFIWLKTIYHCMPVLHNFMFLIVYFIQLSDLHSLLQRSKDLVCHDILIILITCWLLSLMIFLDKFYDLMPPSYHTIVYCIFN